MLRRERIDEGKQQLSPSPVYPPDAGCTTPMDEKYKSSYYGVTFLLPRYYADISGGQANFVFLLSALVGATFIPVEFLPDTEVAISPCL